MNGKPSDSRVSSVSPEVSVSTALVHDKSNAAPFLMTEALKVANGKHGRSYGELVMEMARLAFGPGKVLPPEYFAMRLYDGVPPEAQAQFVGRRIEALTNRACNYDRHWYAAAEDKLLYSAALKGLGLPTPEVIAVFHPRRSLGTEIPALRTVAELEAWLGDASRYPMFGKPNDVRWSLGAASLSALHGNEVEDLFGGRFPLGSIAEEIGRYSQGGYLFQRRLTPHPALVELHGPALSTVRVFVIQDEQGPRIVRTHIKIPSGKNVADNTWRTGNLAAAVDPETGTLQTVWRGSGVAAEAVTSHPETGREFTGVTLPHWPLLRDTVLEGARCLAGLNIQGWDVAICEQGPVLVEVNADPDWSVSQRLTKTGMMDPAFRGFVDGCIERGKAFQQRLDAMGGG